MKWFYLPGSKSFWAWALFLTIFFFVVAIGHYLDLHEIIADAWNDFFEKVPDQFLW